MEEPMDEKLKMPPPEDRRIITADAPHPAFGSTRPAMAQLPGAIKPAAGAEQLTAAVTYIPAPGLEDMAPSGIYWATDQGIILSQALQEPMQLEHMPEGEEKEDERPEGARPEDEGSEP
jgi:hypothetical protein